MAAYAGFAEESYDDVFIMLDKMDKIGAEGVLEELIKAGYGEDKANKYLDLFKGATEGGTDGLKYVAEHIKDYLDEEVSTGLNEIIESVNAGKSCNFEIEFDPTLVRGMSYYTGPIFEVAMPQFGGSCGGGGRYDEMVGRFTGQSAPACGFSVGFERIITILMEKGYKLPGDEEKTAFLLEKGLDAAQISEAMAAAEELRSQGRCVLTARMAKNKKFQKEQLSAQGYTDIREFFKK
jgi:histidyl-tRNA synthetase